MLFTIAVTVSGADEQDYVKAEWNFTDNYYNVLKNGDNYYKKNDYSERFYIDRKVIFHYNQTIAVNGENWQIQGNSADPDFVFISKDGSGYTYVNNRGAQILEDFISRKECIYYLENDNYEYARLSEELINALNTYESYSSKFHMDVAKLGNSEVLIITARDITESLAIQHGAIHKMSDGSYYYLTFADLDNSHFDADGYFSYRSGKVDVVALNDELIAEIQLALQNMERKTLTHIYETNVLNGVTDIYGNTISYEDDYYYSDHENNGAMLVIVFYISFVIVGFIAPAPLLILGLLLPRSKKSGKPTYWYSLAIVAGVWILSAAVFMILLLV